MLVDLPFLYVPVWFLFSLFLTNKPTPASPSSLRKNFNHDNSHAPLAIAQCYASELDWATTDLFLFHETIYHQPRKNNVIDLLSTFNPAQPTSVKAPALEQLNWPITLNAYYIFGFFSIWCIIKFDPHSPLSWNKSNVYLRWEITVHFFDLTT